MDFKIVETRYGTVEGIPSDQENVIVFKGIPIGADTAMENRFCAPKPLKPWDGVRLCDRWPDRFWQEPHEPGSFWKEEFHSDPYYEPGVSENGLAVNLYTPADAGEGKLPVFVFIHGGGFRTGYASEEEFNASHLAAQKVVVVLLQYRLGMLGWLALPELSAESGRGTSGNYAVLDVIHGLEWVRDNIEGFGGDPSKVTIGGQSAGAMMVTCLLRSPLAKGLFRGAIVQSGFDGFLNMPGLGNDFLPIRSAEQQNEDVLARLFGKRMKVEELRRMPMSALQNPASCTEGKTMTLFQALSQAAGQMVLDGYVFTEESIDLLRPESLNGIPVMMGGTVDEATTLIGDFLHLLDITPDNVEEKMAQQFGDGCAKYYAVKTKKEAERSLMRAMSDQYFQKYLLTAAMTEGCAGHRTYVYRFGQVPPGRNSEFRGAYHSSDLWYMFDSIRETENQRKWTKKDHEMAEMMSKYWMNFVKYGNPNGECLPDWEPCTVRSGLQFMELKDGKAKMAMNTDNRNRDLHHRRWLMEHCRIRG